MKKIKATVTPKAMAEIGEKMCGVLVKRTHEKWLKENDKELISGYCGNTVCCIVDKQGVATLALMEEVPSELSALLAKEPRRLWAITGDELMEGDK